MSRKFATSTAIAFGVLALTGLSLTACKMPAQPGKAGGNPVTVMPPSPYATIAAGKVDVDGGVVEVAARRGGVVDAVFVQEGDIVKKGQIVRRIRTRFWP